MFKKICLSLLFFPLFAHAEIVCLEDPSTGRCHSIDLNAEVFKSADSLAVARYAKPTTVSKASSTNNHVQARPTPKMNRQIIAQQRITQRAKIIEARANKRLLNNR